MYGSTGAESGALTAILVVVGIIVRSVARTGRQERVRQAHQAAYTPHPAPPPPPMRDPMLLTAAMRENEHPDPDVRQAAAAYLAGQLADPEYAALRTRLPALYAPWPTPSREPEDAIPPEYQHPRP